MRVADTGVACTEAAAGRLCTAGELKGAEVDSAAIAMNGAEGEAEAILAAGGGATSGLPKS